MYLDCITLHYVQIVLHPPTLQFGFISLDRVLQLMHLLACGAYCVDPVWLVVASFPMLLHILS